MITHRSDVLGRVHPRAPLAGTGTVDGLRVPSPICHGRWRLSTQSHPSFLAFFGGLAVNQGGLTANSFDPIYAEHAAFIFRVVRALGVPPALVQDAVRDVFILAHHRYPEFDGRHALRTWLFEIGFRVVRDYYPREDSPAQRAEQSDELRRLSDSLDQLDDDKRIALVMVEVESMSVQEVAELTSTPLNVMETRLGRARIAFDAAARRATPQAAGSDLSPEARELLQRGRDAFAPEAEEIRAVREALRTELGADESSSGIDALSTTGEALSSGAEPLAAAAWKLVAIAVLVAAAVALYTVLQ